MLEVERINYSIPRRYISDADSVVNENSIRVCIDFDAKYKAEDLATANEVVGVVQTWQFKDELTADEYHRLLRLNKLLVQQLSGKSVSRSTIKRSLTHAEFADYENSLTQPVSIAEVMYADGVPDVLKRYNLMLRDADFTFGRYEKMSGLLRNASANFKQQSIQNTYYKSEHLYERALEYLQEQIGIAERDSKQGELMHWFDRDIDFTVAGNIGIDVDSMPRVKGSVSHYAQDAGLPKLSVRLKREQRLLENLLRAAVACAYVPEPEVVVQAPIKLKHIDISKLHPERD